MVWIRLWFLNLTVQAGVWKDGGGHAECHHHGLNAVLVSQFNCAGWSLKRRLWTRWMPPSPRWRWLTWPERLTGTNCPLAGWRLKRSWQLTTSGACVHFCVCLCVSVRHQVYLHAGWWWKGAVVWQWTVCWYLDVCVCMCMCACNKLWWYCVSAYNLFRQYLSNAWK